MDGRMEQREREARKRGGGWIGYGWMDGWTDGWIWRLMDEWMDV